MQNVIVARSFDEARAKLVAFKNEQVARAKAQIEHGQQTLAEIEGFDVDAILDAADEQTRRTGGDAAVAV